MKSDYIPKFLETLIALRCARYPLQWCFRAFTDRDFWTGAAYFLPLGISSARVIVDVGANEGYWAAMAAAFLHPGVLVSIEPLPALQPVLHSRLDGRRAIIVPCAAGATEGSGVMHMLSHVPASSLLNVSPRAKNDPWPENGYAVIEDINVEIRPLDSICKDLGIQSIDVLKLDVQGFELEVLRGATGILSKTCRIICEVSFAPTYEGGPLFPDLNNWLEEHGFALSGFFGFAKPLSGRLVQCDAVFLNTGLS